MAPTYPRDILSEIKPVEYSNDELNHYLRSEGIKGANSLLAKVLANQFAYDFPGEVDYESLKDGTAKFYDLIPTVDSKTGIAVKDLPASARAISDEAIIKLFSNAEDGGFFDGVQRSMISMGLGSAGGIAGAKLGAKLPGPPQVRLGGAVAGYLLGTGTGFLSGEGLTNMIFDEEQTYTPSSRPIVEAGKTATAAGTFFAQPFSIPKNVNFNAAQLLKNIENMNNKYFLKKDLITGKLGPEFTNKALVPMDVFESYYTKPSKTLKFTNTIEKFLQRTGKTYQDNKKSMLALEAAAGTGATAGAYLSESQLPTQVGPRIASEVGGSLLANLSGARLLSKSGSIIDFVKRYTKKVRSGEADTAFREYRLGEAALQVRKILEESGEDVDAVIEKLAELDLGGLGGKDLADLKLTAAQKTGSPPLMALEAALSKTNEGLGKIRATQNQEADQAFRNLITLMVRSGDPQDLKLAADLQQEMFSARIQTNFTTRVQNLVNSIDQIKKGPFSEEDTFQLGIKIGETLNQSIKEARKVEADLWKGLKDLNFPIDIQSSSTYKTLQPKAEGGVLPNNEFLTEASIFNKDPNIKNFLIGYGIFKNPKEAAKIDTSLQKKITSLDLKINELADSKTKELYANFSTTLGFPLDGNTGGLSRGTFTQQELERINSKLSSSANLGREGRAGAFPDAIVEMIDLRLRSKYIGPVDRKQLNKVKQYANKLSEKQRLELKSSSELSKESTKNFTIGDLMEFRTLVLRKGREANANRDPESYYLFELAEALTEDINNFKIDEATLDDSIISAYNTARSYSKSLNDVYTRTIAGDMFAKAKTGARKIPIELLAEELIPRLNGKQSGTFLRISQLTDIGDWMAANNVKGSEDYLLTINGTVNQILRNLRDEATTKDGLVDANKLRQWREDPSNKKLLEKHTNLAKDLNNLETAQVLLDRYINFYGVPKEVDIAGKKLKTKKGSIQKMMDNQVTFQNLLPKIGGYENPIKVVEKAFSSKTPIKNLDNLVQMINKSEGVSPTFQYQKVTKGDATKGLKSSILEFAMVRGGMTSENFRATAMFDTLFKQMPNGTMSLEKFMLQRGIIEKNEINKLRTALIEMVKYETAMAAGNLGDVAKDAAPLFDFWLRVSGSALGGSFQKLLPGGGGAGSLVAAGAGSKLMRRMFQSLPESFKMDAMSALMENPELLANLMSKPKSERELMRVTERIQELLVDAGLLPLRRAVSPTTRETLEDDDVLTKEEILGDKVSSVQPSVLPSLPTTQGPPPEMISPSLASASPIQPIAGPNVNQNQRAKLAAAFPFDITSDVDRMKQAGIGSLMG